MFGMETWQIVGAGISAVCIIVGLLWPSGK